MNISIKTSFQTYLTLLVIFSPATIVGPAYLVYQGKYIDSNIWLAHIVVTAILFILLMYIYQEVHISNEGLTLRRCSFFGIRTTKVYFDEVTSWSSERVVRVFIPSKEVVKINWIVFRRSDQKLLLELLFKTGIKHV